MHWAGSLWRTLKTLPWLSEVCNSLSIAPAFLRHLRLRCCTRLRNYPTESRTTDIWLLHPSTRRLSGTPRNTVEVAMKVTDWRRNPCYDGQLGHLSSSSMWSTAATTRSWARRWLPAEQASCGTRTDIGHGPLTEEDGDGISAGFFYG